MARQRGCQTFAGRLLVSPQHQIVREYEVQLGDEILGREVAEPASKLGSARGCRTKQRRPEWLDRSKEFLERRIALTEVDLLKDEVLSKKLLHLRVWIRHGIQFRAAESAGGLELDQERQSRFPGPLLRRIVRFRLN